MEFPRARFVGMIPLYVVLHGYVQWVCVKVSDVWGLMVGSGLGQDQIIPSLIF